MPYDLWHIKQQFTLGSFKAVVATALPDPTSPDYLPALIYRARSHVAIDDPDGALQLLLTADAGVTENIAVRAMSGLARYVSAASARRTSGGNDGTSASEEGDAGGARGKETALEELRDLCVEIEGDEAGAVVEKRDRGLVRVLAGTAFVLAGEVEEALETLGAGTDTENLEAVAIIVHIYLSIYRADLAKKEFDRCKRWAEDDLLLQLIEASIGLVTGKESYANAYAFYTEQLGNPSLTSSPHLLVGRGVTRVLRGETVDAKSDLEEALTQLKNGHGDGDALAALAVAAGLGATKRADADDLWTKLTVDHPNHPLVVDVARKAAVFDELVATSPVVAPA